MSHGSVSAVPSPSSLSYISIITTTTTNIIIFVIIITIIIYAML